MTDNDTIGFDSEEVAAQDDGDFEVGQADLGIDSGGDDMFEEDDLGFDGTEDTDDGGGGTSSGGATGDDGPDVEDAINSGLGRAAVYGLNEPEKSELEDEFTEIAEAFHVGYFGDQVLEEYFDKDIEEIPPAFGLAAASLAFAVVVIQRRPDGEQIIRNARWKMGNFKEQYLDEDEPAPEPDPEPEPDPATEPTADAEEVEA